MENKQLKNTKYKLAIALEQEAKRLPEYNVFGEKNSTEEYIDAIVYLKTDILPKNWEDNGLIDAIVHDFETICNDYEIK